jgi:hypothetical protein
MRMNVWRCPIFDRLERGFTEDAMTVSELFAVACGLSLLFLLASFWQGDDSGGWA